MRFHGLMLVRDESDIIAQSLVSTLSWIDSITILDTGSTDGTWEIINEIATNDERVLVVERKPLIFSQLLRAYLFHRVRHNFCDGDWIVKLDADEFFHIPPPRFVSNFLRPYETCIYLQWFFFRLTSTEVHDYESGVVDLYEDRLRPIEERRRFYKIPSHSEPRLFRYRLNMKWDNRSSFPHHAGFIAQNRIGIRHYPHRDPVQMQRRYELRARMKQLNAPAGPHWDTPDWRRDVINTDDTSESAIERLDGAPEGLSAAPGHTNGPLHYWENGASLPEVFSGSHLPPTTIRVAKRFLHQFVLPFADRLQRGYSMNQLSQDDMQ